MKYLTHIVATRVRFSKLSPGYQDELYELRLWLKENIGVPYKSWVTETNDNDQDTIIVKCRTAEQATLIALKWA
mgnify:FL=1